MELIKAVVLFIVVSVLVIGCEAQVNAQDIVSLEQALGAGNVVLENVKGTGRSSGTVVEGRLRNTTNKAIKIFTLLDEGLFLRNSGRGQNMISTEIYHSTGRYWVEKGDSFIEVNPSQTVDIVMTSYCADFDKDNPTPQERFGLSRTPQWSHSILRKIRVYRENNPNEDITVSAQTALWLIQRYTMKDIRGKFHVSISEEALAHRLMQ